MESGRLAHRGTKDAIFGFARGIARMISPTSFISKRRNSLITIFEVIFFLNDS